MIAQERINSNDGEICENLYFLGKKGTMTTAQGLKIAFLSGIDDKHQAPDGVGSPAPSYYSKADIDTLKNTKMPLTAPAGVDVLLTTEWPKGIENNSAKAPSSLNTADCFSLAIAELALALKPRYHFADAANLFYEREPYKNTTGFGGSDERPASHVSRFIGLGKVLNKNKQRVSGRYRRMRKETQLSPMIRLVVLRLQHRTHGKSDTWCFRSDSTFNDWHTILGTHQQVIRWTETRGSWW